MNKKWKTDLSNQDRVSNLLHKDGMVHYYRNALTNNEADRYFDLLLQNIHGKTMKPSFSVSISLQREKSCGMVILITYILIF
jgi:hypothetical protein